MWTPNVTCSNNCTGYWMRPRLLSLGCDTFISTPHSIC
jgi:hypothetical protein